MSTDAEDSRPLTIIVVGAGLVGFAAAVALRREGHCVTVRLFFGVPPKRFRNLTCADLRSVQLQN